MRALQRAELSIEYDRASERVYCDGSPSVIFVLLCKDGNWGLEGGCRVGG